MEAPIHSSFIPTQDALPRAQEVQYGKTMADVFVLLGLIALIISGAVSVGVFLYSQYAVQQLERQKAQLQTGQKSFSVDAIDQLMRLDERLRLGESLLANHTAPSVLFAILQQTTLQSIQFTSLEYTQKVATEIKVSMKGKAKGVNAIALQANIFSRHPAIKDPIFQVNDFTKDGVVFTVTMNLNPDLIHFQSLMLASLRARQQAEQAPDGSGGADTPQDQPNQGEFQQAQQLQQPTRTPTPNAPSRTAPQQGSGFGAFN